MVKKFWFWSCTTDMLQCNVSIKTKKDRGSTICTTPVQLQFQFFSIHIQTIPTFLL